MTMTQGERITALEVENRLVKLEVSELRIEAKEMNRKLDELLLLRAKGQGAFWLGTVVFGTSLAGLISYVVSIFK